MAEYIERKILLDHSEEILNALKNIEKVEVLANARN